MQRFELWAQNLGLYTGGHSSLDYRFRDAQLLFDHTLSLLNDLARILTQLLRVDEKHEGPDEQEISDDSEEEDVSSYQEKPLFELLTDNATATVNKLYRLAFKIRNPAMRLGTSRSLRYSEYDKETGVDLIEQFAVVDYQYIRDLFHSYDSSHPENYYLISRLAKANTRQRQQFRYWKKRKEAFKKMSMTDLIDDKEQREHLAVPGMKPINLAPSQPSTATWLNADKVGLDNDDAISVSSKVSFLPSSDNHDTDTISLPPPPRLTPEVKEFECPYCFTICPQKLAGKRNWETHIMRDLRPYICTYQHCPTPDQPYDSLGDWRNHEVLNHSGNGHNAKKGTSDPCQHGLAQPESVHDCLFCTEAAVSPFHVA